MKRTITKPRNILCIIIVILFMVWLLWQNYQIINQMKETARTEGIYVGREID